MIDEKKLISELKKWMNDTAYLKEKYSGSVQFKDGAGDNIIYAHAEIAYDVISTVIDKINEQEKVGQWILCSNYMPKNMQYVLVTTDTGIVTEAFYSERKNMFIKSAGPTLKVIAWMPLPKGISTVRNCMDKQE